MKIIPAIDIYNKQAVRLFKGDYNQLTVYGSPVEIAKKWESEGASFIHLVDLNGAKDGTLTNLDTVKAIVEAVSIPCELGGGVRSIENIKVLLSLGLNRVILGSKALDIEFLKECLATFGPNKIVVGIDSMDLIIKTHGWLNNSNLNAVEYGKKIKALGVKTVIFTDISKDGTLDGISVKQTEKMIKETGLEIIASGGANNLTDIKDALKIGCEGIILGKSLYQGTIELSEAIKLFEV